MPLSKPFRRLRALLVLLLLALLLLAWGVWRKHGLDGAAQATSLQITEQFLARQDVQALVANSDGNLQTGMGEEKWRAYLTVIARLGQLQLLESISGSSDVSLFPLKPDGSTAAYRIDTHFDNGDAEVAVSLVYRQGAWRITEFIVDSPLIAE